MRPGCLALPAEAERARDEVAAGARFGGAVRCADGRHGAGRRRRGRRQGLRGSERALVRSRGLPGRLCGVGLRCLPARLRRLDRNGRPHERRLRRGRRRSSRTDCMCESGMATAACRQLARESRFAFRQKNLSIPPTANGTEFRRWGTSTRPAVAWSSVPQGLSSPSKACKGKTVPSKIPRRALLFVFYCVTIIPRRITRRAALPASGSNADQPAA